MIVAGGHTPPPLPLALTVTATQSLTSSSNCLCSLPCCHLEQSPPSIIVVVIVTAIVNVIQILVIVDVPRPSPFRRLKLIFDCFHCNTIASRLPPLAFVLILAPLLLLPTTALQSPPPCCLQSLPPCCDLFLGGGSNDSNWHVEGGFNIKNATINCVIAP
jgi:hypothetical protein